MHLKAVIARSGFALCSGQRVFLFGLRMQKNREVFAYAHEARIQHLLRRTAHDAPISVSGLAPHQCIAHRAPDKIDLSRNFHDDDFITTSPLRYSPSGKRMVIG